MSLDILDHFHDLQVCTAVAGTLEGKACGGDGGVGIGVGRGDDVGRKGRVVAAAVFGMDDEADIKQFCFEASIGAVRAEEAKDVFGGIISGVTEWGIYVELNENKCEGMISVRDLDNDFYIFDDKNYCIVGRRTNRKFQLGDEITVRVAKANLAKKQLDFVLA